MKILALLFSLLLAIPAYALTPAQMTTLQTNILADHSFDSLPHNTDGAYAIAVAYNLPASSTFIVWKTSVDPAEIMAGGMDWTRVDNLTVGKSRIWDWMTRLNSFDASKANVRAGIDAVWVGTAADLAERADVYTHCKRQATRLEKLFATGTGTDASPATMVIEGQVTYQDVATTMGW